MNLLIDIAGIKVRGEDEWHARKHGGARQRVLREVYFAVDEVALEVRAVESSPTIATGPKEPLDGSYIDDAPMSLDLLRQIPAGEPVGSVTAEGAHDTRGCHDAIAGRGAEAVIPLRWNTKP